LLLGLRERGVRIAAVTHAAGLSSTGDPAIDAALPLAERYDIPAHTVREIETTRAAGGRVIAVGTTVVRALESAASLGLRAGSNITTLRIARDSKLRVVDGLLTGMHAPTESHFELLEAFVSPALLERAWSHAEREGYRCHEFGDSTLVLAA
jgi:S-adenosylmethionine:tRNA ribosyltransferase-isomerase